MEGKIREARGLCFCLVLEHNSHKS